MNQNTLRAKDLITTGRRRRGKSEFRAVVIYLRTPYRSRRKAAG